MLLVTRFWVGPLLRSQLWQALNVVARSPWGSLAPPWGLAARLPSPTACHPLPRPPESGASGVGPETTGS